MVASICKRVCPAKNANIIYFALLLRFGTDFSIDITHMSHSILWKLDVKRKKCTAINYLHLEVIFDFAGDN